MDEVGRLDQDTRDMMIELMSRDRDKCLSAFLTNEQRRAVIYMFEKVPAEGRYNPDRIPEAPFSQNRMRRLLDPAIDAIFEAWLSKGRESG